jgi:hypothetical protein
MMTPIATNARYMVTSLSRGHLNGRTDFSGPACQTNERHFRRRVLRNRPRNDVKTTNTEVFVPSETERVL